MNKDDKNAKKAQQPCRMEMIKVPVILNQPWPQPI